MYKYKDRKEVPKKYKWNLTDYFKNEKTFNESLNKTKLLVEELKEYKGCTKDGKKLADYLTKEIEAYSNALDLYVYSYLLNDEELGIKANIERKNKTKELMNDLEINTSFFENELLSLSNIEYEKLIKSNNKLKEFKSDLDRIYRNKKHIIPEKEENIITKIGFATNNFSSISSNMLNKEHDYGKIKIDNEYITITTNNYSQIMENSNRKIRKQAYTKFYDKIEDYSTTSAELLNSYVKYNNTNAILHNFESAWHRKLFYLNLDEKVFKSLVSAVNEKANIMTNYYSLKKKILGLKKIYPYDLGVHLTKNNKEYTIEEAQELIKDSLRPLGKDYLNKLDKIFDNNYIDYCGYKGKCSGGYSFGTLTKNSRILMSYNGGLDSVSTIIHESGHNIHHQYLIENNNIQHRDQTNLVCEVASLTNECLLSHYLSKNGKIIEEKLSGIENILRIITTNLFGAVREGKIEEEMYKELNTKGLVTKEFLDSLVEKSLKKYYGNVVTYDDKIKNSWITRSHYYMNFYLYSYAISISVAIKVANEIINGNKKMLEKYIRFLSTGSDIWTIDVFKILGIDLTDKNIYLNAIEYFNKLLKEYEQIYYYKEVNV